MWSDSYPHQRGASRCPVISAGKNREIIFLYFFGDYAQREISYIPWVYFHPVPKYKGTPSLLFHRPILALRLELHHAGIDTVLFQERIGTALLRHCAFRQNNDLIRSRNGTHTVGNNHDCFILDQP